LHQYAFTGASAPSTTATSMSADCNDWTSASSALYATSGEVDSIANWWSISLIYACNSGIAIYCVEQ
ncbi:MAG: hypothetical protein ABI321_14675, partial [Polyangia bacterium]